MKKSTKPILLILLISALLILNVGCFLVPPKEEPGYTPGTLTGTMARPMVCCEDPEGELVGDPISPNICDELSIPFDTVDWYTWANVQVVLTAWVDSEEVELATTVTDVNGDYIFSDVPSPGINYIITAICPTDEDFMIKDVVEELVEGGVYDAGIADAESTILALCLDGLGEIGLDSYLLDLDDFRSHDYYDEVIEEVCGYLADCDHAIPLWVCVLTELCLGNTPTPGYTPTPGNTPTLEPVTYTLTMAADPVGGGTTSPAVGTHPDYTAGAVENITATPNSGYQFVDWTGDVADPNSVSTTVTMNADKTVTANFELIPAVTYDLTMQVSPIGSGTTTPAVGTHTYPSGTVVDISATPASGYQFNHWSSNVVDPNSASTTVTMDADKTTVVNFALTPSNTMHVSNIDMEFKIAGINVNAIATVTIFDASNNPVVGATVSGTWSGATGDSDSGVTDVNGEVSLESKKVKNPSSGTTFTFTVDNVTKDGWAYNSSANTETSDSISVP